jgi:hypothetical protein
VDAANPVWSPIDTAMFEECEIGAVDAARCDVLAYLGCGANRARFWAYSIQFVTTLSMEARELTTRMIKRFWKGPCRCW